MKRCQTNAEAPECRDYVPCNKPAPHLAHQGDREWWCCDAHATEHEREGLEVEREEVT